MMKIKQIKFIKTKIELNPVNTFIGTQYVLFLYYAGYCGHLFPNMTLSFWIHWRIFFTIPIFDKSFTI